MFLNTVSIFKFKADLTYGLYSNILCNILLLFSLHKNGIANQSDFFESSGSIIKSISFKFEIYLSNNSRLFVLMVSILLNCTKPNAALISEDLKSPRIMKLLHP